ncbi:MAG: GGDEF domain-containing protein [Deltaproteobacteria bacterium]|nr:GGDEF domain-containing protein [Deltaproteobacteria bacterium]
MAKLPDSEEITAIPPGGAPAPADGSAPRHAQLLVLSGTHVGKVYPLSQEATLIGRDAEAQIQLMEAGISRKHALILRRPDGSYELRDAGSRNGTFLSGRRVEAAQPLADGDRVQVGSTSVLKFSYADELESRYARQLYDAALRDPLTGAFNRRYLDERLRAELAFSTRHKAPLALLVADVDHLSELNERLGTTATDRLLGQLGALLAQVIRTEDVLARMQGGEFAVLGRNTDVSRAPILAERIRHHVAQHYFLLDATTEQLTVSVGAVAMPEIGAHTAEELLAAADQALRQAKAQGRNCVITRRTSRGAPGGTGTPPTPRRP